MTTSEHCGVRGWRRATRPRTVRFTNQPLSPEPTPSSTPLSRRWADGDVCRVSVRRSQPIPRRSVTDSRRAGVIVHIIIARQNDNRRRRVGEHVRLCRRGNNVATKHIRRDIIINCYNSTGNIKVWPRRRRRRRLWLGLIMYIYFKQLSTENSACLSQLKVMRWD